MLLTQNEPTGGLLGFIRTPEGQGLLSAAFAGLAGARKGQPLNSLGRAGMAGISGYAGALDAQARAAEAAQGNELRQVQVAKARQELSAAEKAAAEQARIDEAIRNALQPTTGTNANAASGITGPRPEAAAAIGTMPQINPMQLLAQGVPFERVKQLVEAQNLDKPKVARVQEVEGPNGTKVLQGYDEYGNPVGQGANGYMAPVQVNQGDKTTFVRPMAGQSFQVNMSPSERDASARGWATVQQGQQRLNQEAGEKQVKLTEGEAKNSLYLGQMLNASQILNESNSQPLMVAATGNPWTNWTAGPNAQKAAQAQRQWAEAFLRAKTGAAATAPEVEGNIRTFFPVVGDGPEVIAQKAAARRAAEEDMKAPAGRGAQGVVNRNTPQPTPAAPGTTARWEYVNGKLVKVN